jgi:hypothetical protein
MPKPNYKFDKRQRDIAKKKKQDEKRLRKLEKNRPADAEAPPVEGPEDAVVAN